MNLVTIAWKSIRQRALASSLTALSVALGVMLMVSVLVIYGIVDRIFSQNSVGYHLIVGPKGSDLQLVLSAIYRVSPPIENLPYLYYQQIKDDPRIEDAVPLAFGDVTEEGSFPILGTVSRYFKIPPFRCTTSSMPSLRRKAVDFSQRMPPVQYMATFLMSWVSRYFRNQAGKSRNDFVSGSTAPSNFPMLTS